MNISTDQLNTIEQALTLQTSWADALKVIESVRREVADKDLMEAARNKHVTDDVEIDDMAGISPNDHGCWVQAWVHVQAEACECQEDGIVDPETGVIDCGKCDGSGFLGWEEC